MKSYSDWLGLHFFYQGSRDQLLVSLVAPLVRRLWTDGAIRRFFFMRYALGGPHIRLRLHCVPSRRRHVSAMAEDMASEFFEREPSPTTLTDEEIRSTNRRLLANDVEGEDEVYPNNSWLRFPFRAEVERYGGYALLEHSLDFFAVSSLDALEFAATRRGPSLAAITRRLVGLALRLSMGTDDFVELLRYASVWSKNYGALFNQRGDEEFERRREPLLQMVRAEIEAAVVGTSLPEDRATLLEGGRRLSVATAGAGKIVRESIAVGQLHMMVNRLGLNNAEEIYLGRMLWRTAERLREIDPNFWSWFADALDQGGTTEPGPPLADLLPRAFDAFCAGCGKQLANQHASS